MRRTLPSMTALAAFESAARHNSFTKAADELHVTQGAVCRQIASLEAQLDLKLFRRSSRGVVLTEAGAAYSQRVRKRLEDVERDTLDLMAGGGYGGALELGVVPSFCTRWLIPRLTRFQESHPGITVNLSVRTRPFLFDATPFDAAIFAGDAAWPGTQGVDLMDEHMVPVCSPDYLACHGGKRAREIDWGRVTLLQQSTRPHSWRQWFTSRGMAVDGDMVGPRFELFSMQIEAAMHAMGVALVPRLLVDKEVRCGVLRVASPHSAPAERRYQLIFPEHKADNARLARFRDWLVQEAVAYNRAG
ncbi:MAG: LysR substrate-binding domain-containing protein [Burkholderiaceae bacterium]